MEKILSFLFVLICYISKQENANAFIGLNTVSKSTGYPLPRPQSWAASNNQFRLDSSNFKFEFNQKESESCDLLIDAVDRYYKIIFDPTNYEIVKGHTNKAKKTSRRRSNKNYKLNNDEIISKMIIIANNPCEDYPNLDTDESCSMRFLNTYLKLLYSNILFLIKIIYKLLLCLQVYMQQQYGVS
jgi:hypothetical protein